jgi:hypothetical protein
MHFAIMVCTAQIKLPVTFVAGNGQLHFTSDQHSSGWPCFSFETSQQSGSAKSTY